MVVFYGCNKRGIVLSVVSLEVDNYNINNSKFIIYLLI